MTERSYVWNQASLAQQQTPRRYKPVGPVGEFHSSLHVPAFTSRRVLPDTFEVAACLDCGHHVCSCDRKRVEAWRQRCIAGQPWIADVPSVHFHEVAKGRSAFHFDELRALLPFDHAEYRRPQFEQVAVNELPDYGRGEVHPHDLPVQPHPYVQKGAEWLMDGVRYVNPQDMTEPMTTQQRYAYEEIGKREGERIRYATDHEFVNEPRLSREPRGVYAQAMDRKLETLRNSHDLYYPPRIPNATEGFVKNGREYTLPARSWWDDPARCSPTLTPEQAAILDNTNTLFGVGEVRSGTEAALRYAAACEVQAERQSAFDAHRADVAKHIQQQLPKTAAGRIELASKLWEHVGQDLGFKLPGDD